MMPNEYILQSIARQWQQERRNDAQQANRVTRWLRRQAKQAGR